MKAAGDGHGDLALERLPDCLDIGCFIPNFQRLSQTKQSGPTLGAGPQRNYENADNRLHFHGHPFGCQLTHHAHLHVVGQHTHEHPDTGPNHIGNEGQFLTRQQQ